MTTFYAIAPIPKKYPALTNTPFQIQMPRVEAMRYFDNFIFIAPAGIPTKVRRTGTNLLTNTALLPCFSILRCKAS